MLLNIKKYLLLSFLLVTVFSISQDKEKNLRVYLGQKQFSIPHKGEYVEIQLHFEGYTLQYLALDGGLQSTVEVRLAVYQGDSLKISDNYRLNSPIMKDSIIDDFYDLRRFALLPGNYNLVVEIKDLNSTNEPIKASKQIKVEKKNDIVSISDIEVAELITRGDTSSVFFKTGYNIIPRILTYYPEEFNSLPVYFEMYNTDQIDSLSAFILEQKIIDKQTGNEIVDFTRLARMKSSSIIPFIRNIDIGLLPTGNYDLVFKILDKKEQVLSQKKYSFERMNEIETSFNADVVLIDPAFQESIHSDSVRFFLSSLIPIANQLEVKNILKILQARNDSISRKQIQGFWLVTSGNRNYEEWVKYKAQVLMVEKLYSNSFQAGFETDRGRVYLQYGSPTTAVQKDVSSTEYPYEIWQYNKIGRFSNKRFVFYNPDLVTNGYRLLHSDMVGELKNNSWQYDLNKRNTPRGNIDDSNQFLDNSYGTQSNDLFRQY